jgi:hypothetical protein
MCELMSFAMGRILGLQHGELPVARRLAMKNPLDSIIRRLPFVILLTVFASSMLNAEQIKGSFTIPFDAYWGDILLPAGHYTFNLDTTAATHVVLHPGLQSKFLKFGYTETLKSPAKSQLVIVRVGDMAMVNALYIGEVKTAFWFQVTDKYLVTHRVIAKDAQPESIEYIPVEVGGK